MAVVSRISTLELTGATGSRKWTATAAVQDTAQGASVQITFLQNKSGATPPVLPTALDLDIQIDNTTTSIKLFNPTPNDTDGNSQAFTFFFTADGNAPAGGNERHGTVRIRIRARQTGGLAATQYDVNSDGSNPSDTLPTGFSVGQRDQGWMRGSTTAVEKLSNVSLGGTKSQPAEYDESLFVRITLGSVGYAARSLTVDTSSGGLSGNTNSTTAKDRDVTFANVVDDRFPAAVTAVGVTETVPSPGLATGAAAFPITSVTDDTIDVDPRLSATHHFQVDDDVFAVSKNDTGKAMLSTQTGFIATRFVTARTTTGINGLTVTQALDPLNPGNTISGSSATAARDGQAGWTDLLAWPESKPGGAWNKSVDITAPSDIDADTMIRNGTDTLTMLAPDPRIEIVAWLLTLADERDHISPGDDVRIVLCAKNRDTRKRLAPDPGTVSATLIRWNPDLSRFEYLATDGVTWTNWPANTAADAIVIPDAGDGITFTRDFLVTDNWGFSDIVAINAVCKIGGTPYGWQATRELVGRANPHSHHEFDPTGLFS